MSKAASLTSGLVAKKGQASPAISSLSPLIPSTSSKVQQDTTTDYYKALTVKLDRNRYETLKSVGVKLDKKSQEIFVEALDFWLEHAVSKAT